MINNRQNNAGRRRGRGGQQRPQGMSGGGSGNARDQRQRGNAAQLLEKYKSLARDSQLAGDRVQTEYWLQFADHYFRVLGESRAKFDEQRRARGETVDDDGYDGDDDGYDEDGDEESPPQQAYQQERQQQPRQQQDRPQQDRGERQDRQQPQYQRDNRPDRYERQDRPERASQPERPERQDRQRAERPQRDFERQPERVERPQRADNDRPERVQRADNDRPSVERSERAERPERAPRPRRVAAEPLDEPKIDFAILPPAIGMLASAPEASPSEDAVPAPRRRGRPPKARPEGEADIAPAA
ncbi:MAG: DUF4167 domain-containing protein [Sphingomicrobium sp.]